MIILNMIMIFNLAQFNGDRERAGAKQASQLAGKQIVEGALFGRRQLIAFCHSRAVCLEKLALVGIVIIIERI